MTRLIVTTVPLLLIMVAAAGCNEGQTDPAPLPVLRIEVHTSGDDLDLDGYQLLIDGGTAHEMRVSDLLVVDDLKPGLHLVELAGVGPNCTTAPRDILPVRLEEADTASLSFEVSCLVTGVRIRLATTGLDPDPSFVLVVDGVMQPTRVTSTGATNVGRLSPGEHRFQLADLAPNCRVAEPVVQTATLVAGTLTPLEFSVACVAATGALLVTVHTDGLDLDPNGYLVSVNGRTAQVGINGSVVISSLAEGSYTVRLSGVQRNCEDGANGRTVSIVAGRTVRDTVSTVFSVTCTKAWELAFSRGGRIHLAKMDGRNPVELADGGSPAWSPDGRRLAYLCRQICITELDGSGTTMLETGDLVDLGSWSPDGTRLVFVSYNCDDYYAGGSGCVQNGLFTIRADGTGMYEIALPTEVSWISAPDWAPDGVSIAFGCGISSGSNGICVTAPNGQGFRLLSQSEAGSNPSWSPDGLRIAFVRWGTNGPEMMIMNADGSEAISTGTRGWQPTWTRDGMRLLFNAMQCNSPGTCDQAGIASVNLDGTGRIEISPERYDVSPSVRP